MNDIDFDENAFIISVGNIYNTEPAQYRRLHGAIIGCFIDIANNLFKNKSIEFLEYIIIRYAITINNAIELYNDYFNCSETFEEYSKNDLYLTLATNIICIYLEYKIIDEIENNL